MTSKEHHKHPKLARPVIGAFARTEWAILGAPCGIIQQLAGKIIRHLSPQFKCAYVDTRHADAPEQASESGQLENGAMLEFTDLIHSRQILDQRVWDRFEFQRKFNETDAVFVNGNHHPASVQIVILHPAKKASLEKRLAQLTRVELLLLPDEHTEIFDFLKEALPDWASIPRLLLSDTDAIGRFIANKMEARKPRLKGLVLAGGESRRMGTDKGAIEYHGKPQRQYVAELMAEFCEETFISARAGQMEIAESGFPVITDTFTGLGPFGAILSAFRQYPDSAWMVLACDLPMIDRDLLKQLVSERKTAAVATAFQSPENEFPEPLITIWEPKSYAVLLSFLSMGYSCPRKVLINSDTHVIHAQAPEKLMNVNTPEELEKARGLLSGKK